MPPQIKTKCSKSILKREPLLMLIPWPFGRVVQGLSILDKPNPDKAIEKAGKRGSLFSPLSFIALRLFSPQILFEVAEGIFNAPAVSKGRDNLCWRQTAIGSKETAIMFFSFRVTGDDQQYGFCFIDGIPQHLTAIDKSLTGLSPLTGLNQSP